MQRVSLLWMKKLVAYGLATEVEKAEDLPAKTWAIAYSAGTYGVTGRLYAAEDTGRLYAAIGRNAAIACPW